MDMPSISSPLPIPDPHAVPTMALSSLLPLPDLPAVPQLPAVSTMRATVCSVWESGHRTEKRPRPDRTKTDQDRKILGPQKTVTAVRSTVHRNLECAKTGLNPK